MLWSLVIRLWSYRSPNQRLLAGMGHMLHTFLLLKVGKFSFLFGSLATSFGWLMYFISRVLRSHWLRLYSLAPLKNLYSVYFQQAHVGFRINLSYFLICILVDDVSNVPFGHAIFLMSILWNSESHCLTWTSRQACTRQRWLISSRNLVQFILIPVTTPKKSIFCHSVPKSAPWHLMGCLFYFWILGFRLNFEKPLEYKFGGI